MGKTRPRVLLVEDTPPLARLYQEYLRFEEIDLEAVECGQQGETKVLRGPLASCEVFEVGRVES